MSSRVFWLFYLIGEQAKDLVEGAPAVVLKGVKKEDTEAIIAKLKEAGAEMELE
jgi:large subunit ribosomal protein L7/L12